MTRHIPLQGVENFRDFGDYAAGAGRMKKGLLFRAAHQAAATDADLEAIAALGLVAIVDLRRAQERQREPSRRWKSFAAEVIDNDLGGEGDDPWQTFLRGWDHSEADLRGYMVESYRRKPFTPRHVDLFRRYFAVLAKARGPVLIHCAAGKDRTGLLAALTHHLAGVSRDDLVEDYLATNDPERYARIGEGIGRYLAGYTGSVPPEAAIRAALAVEAEYILASIEAIEAAHGSIDAYLETVLGVDARTREAIAAHILA
ncbi:tyrosine-protein phosphatase [Caulobacter hibisci]|uniref:Tyrosine-protein phosphatase n=1 Tax=Caulobacter hibisci TaxID=2035993 RepID=A0ABS0T2C5_9CAUL|nr:tyrosine-protein phosphatase [Caulobacter hibisci]MBI1686018.1 tyrosine-protein phosphatase [Caulobacter hibisci]